VKVFVLEKTVRYEGTDVLSVHASLAGAKRAARKNTTKYRDESLRPWQHELRTPYWSAECTQYGDVAYVISKMEVQP